ncbi:MAG: hypothetical protein C4305_07430 [Thermoleophilia bacterium]
MTVAAIGDITMAFGADGGAGFSSLGIRRALAADVALGNLEGTLAPRGLEVHQGSAGCYAFRAPSS